MHRQFTSLLLAGCLCCTAANVIPTVPLSSHALTIVACVKKASVSKDTIAVGESVKIELEWSTGAKQDLIFTSDNADVASVDGSGTITGVSAGSAVITIKHTGTVGTDKQVTVTVSGDETPSTVYNTSEMTLGMKLKKNDTIHYDGKNIGFVANIVNTKGSYDLAFINEKDYVLPFDAELVGNLAGNFYIAPEIEGITYLDGRTLKSGDMIDRSTHLLCYDYEIKSAAKSTTYAYPVFLPEYYGKYIGEGEIRVNTVDSEKKLIVLESANVTAVKGDVNGDGSFAVSDAVAFSKWLMNDDSGSAENMASADLNDDGKLNVFDLVLMRNALKEQEN